MTGSGNTKFDAVIVGAGFAGMYMLHKLRGQGLLARVIEAGTGVGGTWYWNRYPGARVDIESMEYSFSFDPELEKEWRWTERYAPQPELLRYANHVADRYDLRRDIQLETRVVSAVFDEETSRWTVTTDAGESLSARFCIMATGCLSSPKDLEIEGLSDFKGPIYKTFAWPRVGVDFTGQRVGIIGTGSSGIQTITVVAEQAAQLTVFQRTANYSSPAWNRPVTSEDYADWDANREAYRAEARAQPVAARFNITEDLMFDATPEARQIEFERRWQIGGIQAGYSYADIGVDRAANQIAADFFASKIRETVKDPETAATLTPDTAIYPFATKRICVDTGYYEVFNRDTVALVDIRKDPIKRITADGISTETRDFAFDAIIIATGFDAMTGALGSINIRGRGGLALKDKWAEGPRTYLGLMIAGFPNLFTITGPGSPSVLTNMIMSIEQHVEFIADTITHLSAHQLGLIEATTDAENAWVAHVSEVADTTLLPQANSWYMGVNVPGKPRMFMPYVGGFSLYVEACNDIVADGYRGFVTAAA
jgi:cyclohexanone monooxygenase